MYAGEPNLNAAFLQPPVDWVLVQDWNGKLLFPGARVCLEQNYQAGLGMIVGLLGELFIRAANCRHITLSVQK